MTQRTGATTPDVILESSPEVLFAQDLRKSYRDRIALQSLSFSLLAGRVLGFLGPNGAGKTTAIRILTTILPPTSGRFVVDGISSEYPVRIRQRIGVLPEGLGFPRQMTGARYLAYYGQLYGRPPREASAAAGGLLQEVGLTARADSAIGSYSHGMRQRLGIARSLVNDPAVLFLDEPTLGLDPRGQRELLELVRRIAAERRTGVVLCSHLLAEVEGVCDDVVILNAGQVVAKGTVGEVVGQSSSGDRMRVQVPEEAAPHARRLAAEVPQVTVATVSDEAAGWVEVEIRREAAASAADERRARNAVLAALIAADVPVLAVDGGGRLQDVFLRLTAEAIV